MSNREWVSVRHVMHEQVATVNGRIDVLEALKVMKRSQVTCLLIEKRNERDEYGLVLFSDIAKKVIARDRAPERVHVYEIMSKPVISVKADMDIRYCARLFERFGISHAPVIDDEKAIGIVSYYQIVMHGLPELD